MRSAWRLLAASSFILAAQLNAQSRPGPWTQWGIYRDSTGSGSIRLADSVICPKYPLAFQDTVWLIVDTTGMGAAGIQRWAWYNPSTTVFLNQVFPSLESFTYTPGAIKVGLELTPSFSILWSVGLRVYLRNGDSVSFVRGFRYRQAMVSYQMRPLPSGLVRFCPGMRIEFRITNTSDLDSFKVGYGPGTADTIRNQRRFTLTVPSAPLWNIEFIGYACGWISRTYTTISTTPDPHVPVPPRANLYPERICLGDSFQIYAPYDRDTFYLDSVSILRGSTRAKVAGFNRLPASWRPSIIDSYLVVYHVKYPCTPWFPHGSIRWDTAKVYVVGGAIGLPQAIISTLDPREGSCPGTPVRMYASGYGAIDWDVNYDGQWDSLDKYSILAVFPTSSPRIRIRQRLPCISRIDTIEWSPSLSDSMPTFYFNIDTVAFCLGSPVPIRIYRNANFNLSSNTIIHLITSWTTPQRIRIFRLDTVIAGPTTPGSYTVGVRIQNACGKADSFFRTLHLPGFVYPLQGSYAVQPVCAGQARTIRIHPIRQTGEPPFSVRYFLPNGTILGPFPHTDTVSISYPALRVHYLTAERIYQPNGCLSEYDIVALPESRSFPSITELRVESACIGSQADGYLEGDNIYSYQIFLNGNSVLQSTPLYEVYPWSYGYPVARENFTFTVPNSAGPHTLMAVARGCSNDERDTMSLRFTASPAPTVSNPTYQILSGTTVRFSVNASPDAIVFWEFGDGNESIDNPVIHTYAAPGTYNVRVGAINQALCVSDILTLTVRITTSLHSALQAAGWSVYPNPAQDALYITTEKPVQEAEVLLFDLQGRLAAQYKLNEVPARVPLSLAPGVYMGRIVSTSDVLTFRLVVAE
ncbi:MAG: PKD domain-containing protein [Bacteroidia bacterium]|nr:PKD domain-containing protein [Bacteroidia bacterium]MDW8235190.1 PKD domain-containing protein [Bacteroidia bacterium]